MFLINNTQNAVIVTNYSWVGLFRRPCGVLSVNWTDSNVFRSKLSAFFLYNHSSAIWKYSDWSRSEFSKVQRFFPTFSMLFWSNFIKGKRESLVDYQKIGDFSQFCFFFQELQFWCKKVFLKFFSKVFHPTSWKYTI